MGGGGGGLLPSYEKFHQRKFAKKICHNGVSKTTSLGRKNNHTETYKWHSFQARNLVGELQEHNLYTKTNSRLPF
jgi:hypothetical protein